MIISLFAIYNFIFVYIPIINGVINYIIILNKKLNSRYYFKNFLSEIPSFEKNHLHCVNFD